MLFSNFFLKLCFSKIFPPKCVSWITTYKFLDHIPSLDYCLLNYKDIKVRTDKKNSVGVRSCSRPSLQYSSLRLIIVRRDFRILGAFGLWHLKYVFLNLFCTSINWLIFIINYLIHQNFHVSKPFVRHIWISAYAFSKLPFSFLGEESFWDYY